MPIEVVDETGQLTHPLPDHSRHTIISPREEKGMDPVPEPPALPTLSRLPNRLSITDTTTDARPDSISHPRGFTESQLNGGEDRSALREETIPTQLSQDRASGRHASGQELYSPSSEYTKESGGASEDSHIHRTSGLTVSDGGFGIGLSLLQGLASGNRDSRTWSESETDIESSFPKPPTQTQPGFLGAAAKADQRASASSNVSGVHNRDQNPAAPSESDGGVQWDDDDLLDDYRYSRYSLGSKASKQSRSSAGLSLTRPFQGVPPLPEDGRPSIDSQSSMRSAPSPQPQSRISLLTPKPLNIIKNSSREPAPLSSPTTPVPHRSSPEAAMQSEKETTPGLSAPGRRQGSHDEEERPSSAGQLKLPRSEDRDITPKPSNENLTLQTSSMEKMPPSTSNDYNGDESELDESDGEPVEVMSPTPLSPSSTAGSTSSIFLPHPGAPKPVMNNNGQIARRSAAIHIATAAAAASQSNLHGSPPNDSQWQGRTPGLMSTPTAVSLFNTLAMAADRARTVKQTTLYGATQVDLLSSHGPVPIAFSLGGHPPSPGMVYDPDFGLPRRSPTPKASGSPVAVQFPASDENTGSGPQPIPRANFFPSNGRPRPRSRSFSGFSVNDSEVLIPMAG